MVHSRLGWGCTAAVSLMLACSVAAHAASTTGRGDWSTGSVSVAEPAGEVASATGAPAASAPGASVPGTAAPQGQPAVAVDVLGAGLSSGPPDLTVVLHRQGHGSRFSATFVPVTVVDARGTLVGWTLYLSVAGARPAGAMSVRPAAPVTVSGNPSEVRAVDPSPVATSPTAIMAAAPGGGGGTFSESGTIDLVSPSSSGDTVTVHLAVSAS